jgi:radical SAM protein with 4Fe4S-binding SPASM domain
MLRITLPWNTTAAFTSWPNPSARLAIWIVRIATTWPRACCPIGLAVDVCACDHYDCSKYRLDDIATEALGDMALKYAQVQFGLSKSETLPSRCRNCDLLKNCWGECPKGRVLRSSGGEPDLNYLCASWRQSFLPSPRPRSNTSSRTSGATADGPPHEPGWAFNQPELFRAYLHRFRPVLTGATKDVKPIF